MDMGDSSTLISLNAVKDSEPSGSPSQVEVGPARTTSHPSSLLSQTANSLEVASPNAVHVQGTRTWYQTKRKKLQPDPIFKLSVGFNEWFWALLLREGIPIAAIICALTFAGKSQTFSFAKVSILGFNVDVDLQLALIGLINKILDVIVQASFKHTAALFLTFWMALQSSSDKVSRGIHLQDFELKDELVQPWTCIINFWKLCHRRERNKIRVTDLLRFFGCLIISICVLFLALGMNTLGIPKDRWYPDNGGGPLTESVRNTMTLHTPRMLLHGINWANFVNDARNITEGDDSAADLALGLAAAETFRMFKGLPWVYQNDHRGDSGWVEVGNGQDQTSINSNINGSTCESMSVQPLRVWSIYDNLRRNGSGSQSWYGHSRGWNAFVNITIPRLTTVCNNGPREIDPVASGVLTVSGPLSYVPTSSTILVELGSVPALNFSGVTCTVHFRQVLFAVGSAIVNNGDIHISASGYGKKSTTVFIPSSTVDVAIAQALSLQFGALINRMSSLTAAGFLPTMVFIARRLHLTNPRFPPGNDAAVFAPVIGLMAQHLITIANWDMSESPDPKDTVSSYPVRWQVYGSGPRLVWEWISAGILGIVLSTLIAACILKAVWRIQPGPWLELGGMMLLANKSESLESVKGSCAGVPNKSVELANYYVRDVGRGMLRLTESESTGMLLEKEYTYQSEERP